MGLYTVVILSLILGGLAAIAFIVKGLILIKREQIERMQKMHYFVHKITNENQKLKTELAKKKATTKKKITAKRKATTKKKITKKVAAKKSVKRKVVKKSSPRKKAAKKKATKKIIKRKKK